MKKGIHRYGIGTVVKINGVDNLLMISGYLKKKSKDEEKIWDYCAFVFPSGLRDKNECILFDHDMIEDVYAFGYQDKESFVIMRKIDEEAEKLLSDENK